MDRVKRILRGKRGIAIETAVLFMVIIFSFCALLTSLTVFGRLRNEREAKRLGQDVQLQQLGDEFLIALKTNTPFAPSSDTFDCKVEPPLPTEPVPSATEQSQAETETKTYTLTVSRKAQPEQIVLYVQVEVTTQGANRSLNIIQWRETPPQPSISGEAS